MRSTYAGMAGRPPLGRRFASEHDPNAGFRHGELAAALATAAVASQLLFTPAVVLVAAALVAVGRVSRWRPHWLAAATAVGVIWLFAAGPVAAAAAFSAGSRHTASILLSMAIRPGQIAHPGAAAALASGWLVAGLPLAIVAASAEAWLVLWLVWWRVGGAASAAGELPQSGWQWRPGLVAAARRHMSAAAVMAGHTVTRDGCAIGAATATGKLASFSWSAAMHGVLLTGEDRELPGLAIACAALRRRKTLVIIDCAGVAGDSAAAGGRGAVAERVGRLARSLGVPVTAADAGSFAAAIGRAIRGRATLLIPTGPTTLGMPRAQPTTAVPPAKQVCDEARRAAADLAAVLGELLELGLRADCVTWINGVELIDSASVAELLALGPLTGTAIVLSTASSGCAADLASAAAVIAVGHPVDIDLDRALAGRVRGGADRGAAIGREATTDVQLGAADPIWRPVRAVRGAVTMLVFSPSPDGAPVAVTACQVQPIPQDYA